VQHKIQIFTHEWVAYSVCKKFDAGIITFPKLETLTNNLAYVAAWYIAGRGQPTNWAESCSTTLQCNNHAPLVNTIVDSRT
jgi:hypothetical protein